MASDCLRLYSKLIAYGTGEADRVYLPTLKPGTSLKLLEVGNRAQMNALRRLHYHRRTASRLSEDERTPRIFLYYSSKHSSN